MQILENVSLADHSTMRLGGTAAYLTDVASREELVEAITWAQEHSQPIKVIAGGSNIIWNDTGFEGLVIVNKIMGFETYDMDSENAYLTVGAGENWDSVVARAVSMNLSGIEQLSLIPGSAGATPVQNVGAYGREIAEVLVTLEAYDTQVKKFVTIREDECAFEYRSSRFKTTDKDRFYISSITLHLTHTNPLPPFYDSLQQYFTEHNITVFTPLVVREAVIAIRNSKLPDPAVVANCGSFFANPIITTEHLSRIQATHPDLPDWPRNSEHVKIPAGWLVEQCGFKGAHDAETGMATWDKQALVLVNEHAQHTSDLLKFKQKIVDAVQAKFGITLEQEPELI